ncbi:hypothetical protein [Ferrimonas kyonanensis]|uniref:hypothetical protein n=1 Tax=Ferrimonas kyonanensis TaxID=364763 RepID=UPI0004879A9A|nr:hypothetical protein [Ferrimonas kyonanensis]
MKPETRTNFSEVLRLTAQSSRPTMALRVVAALLDSQSFRLSMPELVEQTLSEGGNPANHHGNLRRLLKELADLALVTVCIENDQGERFDTSARGRNSVLYLRPSVAKLVYARDWERDNLAEIFAGHNLG